MNCHHLLAAGIWGYSYANYEDHLGFGNARYDRLMPDGARTLERAVAENWPTEKIAKRLHVELDLPEKMLRSYHLAKQVVDAGEPDTEPLDPTDE